MRLHLLCSAVLTTIVGPAAFAQDAAPRDSAVTLPGVTVTATRNPARVLTTPLAVTKLTVAELRAVTGFGLDEALSRVPGVIAQSRYGTGDVRLMIRGYGARGAGDRSNSGTSRGVRMLLDGFPETEPDGRTAMDQFDLATAEAVEVVRSNASSVWGNAAGGVVNVITVPTAPEPVFEVQPFYGGFGLARYAARSSMPIGSGGDGIVYANFTNTSFDGWRQHSSTRRALVNAGAVGRVGERTRLGLFLTAANNLMHIPGPLTQAQVDADPRQANATYLARDERRYNRTGRLGVTVDHDLNATTSLSSMVYVNPKYLQRSERNTFRDFTRYHLGGNVIGRKSLTTGGVHSRLTAGVDAAYQDGAILFYNLSETQGRGSTLADNKGEGASNLGVFLQDEVAVTDRLSLLLGARYDAVAYSYRSFLPDPPVHSDRRDFSRVSPKLGVNWLLGANHAVYANVGGGIEVPAGNETDPTPGAPPALLNPLLDPILSTTYEMGVKALAARLGAGVTVGYDVALYDIEITNDAIPYNGGRYYLTAGRGRRRGAELGLNARTTAGLFASAAVTVSDNNYLKYVVDSAVLFPTDPTKAGARADYSGNQVIGIPGVLTNVELGTEVPGFRKLRLRAGVEHSGDYYADDANRVRVPAYTILNLTAELRDPLLAVNGVGMRGFVTVRNVADRKYIGSAFLNPDLVDSAPAAYEPGMPRAVIVSVSVGKLR
jgi:iron complex outermembrane receptor protein